MMMNSEYIFRKATKIEVKLIKNHITGNFGENTNQIFTHKYLWIKEGKIKEVFLVSSDLNKILEKITEKSYSAGISIGSIWDDEFQLEIEGSFLILPYTDCKIKVKTSQYLYGKSIFVENVESTTVNFNKDDQLIILGANNLHYGIGKAQISKREMINAKANTILIKGFQHKPFDRGWYLRRGN